MDAANVPEDIWLATMITESGGNPTQQNLKDPSAIGPGNSTGLFQLRRSDTDNPNDPGLGTGYTTAQLMDPVQNATIAAPYMGKAVAAFQGQASYLQLQQVEKAGWPGNLSEDATRQADLATVDAAGVKQTATGDGTATSVATALGNASTVNGEDQYGSADNESAAKKKQDANPLNPLGPLIDWLNDNISGFEHSLVVFIVIILCAVGGFILIAAAAAENPHVQNAMKLGAEASAA